MVHCKMLPMGIYGAEVSFVSDTALRTFRGAMFTSLRSRCDLGANVGLLFSELAARGWEVDPELKVAHNRMLALPRACDRNSELKVILHRIWELHREAGHPATCWDEHVHLKPIAPPGWAARKGWRRGLTARGPVGLLLQSAHAYALALEWGDAGPHVRQRREIPVPLCQGPRDTIKARTLATLERARRAGVSEGKSAWQGLVAWDYYLAKEQTRGMTLEDLSIWRISQCGQFFIAIRAQRLAIVEDSSCFLCLAPQLYWVHLWAECPKLAHARPGLGPFRPHTPHGKSLPAVCRRALLSPQWLPLGMANLGVAMELGADLTRHWWNPDTPPRQEGVQDVDVEAWPACLRPQLAELRPHPAATARQIYDFALGPATALPSLVGPKGTGRATWQANVFTDGAMSQIARWAPWSRTAAVATWTPGRTLAQCPRSPDEAEFFFHQWDHDGLVQWNIVIGCHQTASRAEDFAVLAALLAPHPVTAAIDNASTTSFSS